MKLPTIEIATKATSKTVALGFFCQKPKQPKKGKRVPPKPLYAGSLKDQAITRIESELSKSAHFFGRKNETNFLRFYSAGAYNNVLLFGMGPKENFTTELARQAGAAISLNQKKENLDWIDIDPGGVFKDSGYLIQAFCEGYLMAGYSFEDVREQKPRDLAVEGIRLLGVSGAEVKKAIHKATVLVNAVNFTRGLGDRPGNYLTPTILADILKKMSKSLSLTCTVWNEARLKKERMGLLVGVGEGSEEESRLIQLEYNGGKGKGHIALVGKAITFDTGGISLKPPSKMEEMKYDMMGGATVAGVMQAIANLKLPINVKAYITSAENMPSGTAQKPGDVKISRGGKRIEIINTDAEGRLALADAIEVAQEKKPDAIIDFATLTGAVLVALGTTVSGIMGNHRGLIERLKESAEVTGERVWELPLYEEFEDFFRSAVADHTNSSDIREAGSSKGGTFLKFFVNEDTPWVHCDIAGSAWHRRDRNYHPKRFGSGAMVRLVVHLLENWKALPK